jgi:WD40 repeat protein
LYSHPTPSSGPMTRLGDDMIFAGKESMGIWSIDSKLSRTFKLDILENDNAAQLINYQSNSVFVRRHEHEAFHIVDLQKQCTDRIFYGHEYSVEQLSQAKDLPYLLLSTSADASAKIWDVRQYKCTHTLKAYDNVLFGGAITVLNNVPYVFIGGKTQSILVIDMRMGLCVYEMSTGNTDAGELFWHEKSHSLVGWTRARNYFDNRPTYVQDAAIGEWPKYVTHRKEHFEEIWDQRVGGLFGIYTFDPSLSFDNVPPVDVKHSAKHCAFCGKSKNDVQKLYQCGRCKKVCYCSKEHQHSHCMYMFNNKLFSNHKFIRETA